MILAGYVASKPGATSQKYKLDPSRVSPIHRGVVQEWGRPKASCRTFRVLKPWLKPESLLRYLQGNRIIPGFLSWCGVDFVHPQYLLGSWLTLRIVS